MGWGCAGLSTLLRLVIERLALANGAETIAIGRTIAKQSRPVASYLREQHKAAFGKPLSRAA
jgi:hypothetical protein